MKSTSTDQTEREQKTTNLVVTLYSQNSLQFITVSKDRDCLYHNPRSLSQSDYKKLYDLKDPKPVILFNMFSPMNFPQDCLERCIKNFCNQTSNLSLENPSQMDTNLLYNVRALVERNQFLSPPEQINMASTAFNIDFSNGI